jgi:predicted PurR-regulated permease PerM
MAAARWSPVTKRIVVLLLLAIAVYVIYRAGDIVRPFLWAAVLSYVLLPLVRLLEVRVTHHRGAAAAIVFLALLALIIGGARLLVPLALEQMTMFQRSLPYLIAHAEKTLVEALDQLGMSDLHPIVVGSGGLAPVDFTRSAANLAVPVVVGFGHFLLEFLVFLIATFFLLRDWPRLISWLGRLAPRSYRHELLPLGEQVNVLLGRYVRGQLVLIVIMWVVTTIGLTAFGVPFSFLLGFMTGVLEIIPIIGPITAGAIASLVALGHPNPFGWSQLIYVAAIAIMYTILRHAEDYFVIPLVIGRIVRLHPAVVIFALLGGGALFGLIGVLLAVPVAATLRLVLIYVSAKLRDEDPYPRLEEELAAEDVAPAATRNIRPAAHP